MNVIGVLSYWSCEYSLAGSQVLFLLLYFLGYCFRETVSGHRRGESDCVVCTHESRPSIFVDVAFPSVA